MKTLCSLLLTLLFMNTMNAQVPAWEWARTASTVNYSAGRGIITDRYENTYITGHFLQNMILGADTLLHVWDNDVFLVKFDSAGNVLWARSMGSESFDNIGNPSIDDAGNIFVSGFFYGWNLIIGTDTLSNSNQNPVIPISDIYIVKYDPNGNVLWAKTAGGTGSDLGNPTATDCSGNLYIAGSFSGPTISFDSITLYKVGSANRSLFLTKYDKNGNVLWARAAGGDDVAGFQRMATDLNDNIYLTGSFCGQTITFGTTTLHNSGSSFDDIFLVKYNPSGNVVWAQSFGGVSFDVGLNVATDRSGNVYITGIFSDSTLSLGSFVLYNAGEINGYVAKLDPTGNVLWAKSLGGIFRDEPCGLFVDETGGVYITVDFRSPSITFGNTTHYNLNPVNAGDLFIAKYDSLGNESWAMSVGGQENVGAEISVSTTGNLYIAGGYNSPTIVLGSDTLSTTAGMYRFFVAKASGLTGVENLRHPAYEILLSPNPMKGHVTISVPSCIVDMMFELHDISGRKIISRKINETTRITVADLPAGIYVYKLQYAGGRQTGKMVKIN